jgi:peptidyl-prolyl cis-trans isomerase D
MFDFVRSHTRLLQGVLVLLVFPSFVFFGVQGYTSFRDKAASTVATVDGQPITQNQLDTAFRQAVERMQAQMPGVDVKLFDTPEARNETLDSLVRESVLTAAVTRGNIVVPDQRLQRLFVSDPNYAQLRKPDGSINKDILTAQGLSPAQFEAMLRQELAMRQVLSVISETSGVSKTPIEQSLKSLLQQREIQVQRFDVKSYLARIQPSEAEVEAFYKAHTSQFQAPDEATIQYAVLDLDALKKQVTVSDDDLKKYYDQNASRYTVPEERRASHILIAVAKDAAPDVRAKAKAKAEAILAEVRKNPSQFEALAKKNSDDPGSAQNGGDLDFFGRGAMVKSFEDAAFSMKPGDISGLVESDFGYHIIKLTAVRGGERKPFEAVRSEIQDEVTKQLAQQKFAEVAEQFSNMVYEQSDSLQPIADKLKLTIQTAVVQRTPAAGGQGPLASAKLLESVFSNDSLKNKRNTEAVETGANQLVSARVTEFRAAHVRALSEVRDQVLSQLKVTQAAAAARREGEARLEALKKDGTTTLSEPLTVSRTQGQGLPRQVLDAALKADLAKGPATVGVDLGSQGYVLIKVARIVDRPAQDPELARAVPYIQGALGEAESDAYYRALKRRFKVEVKAKAGNPVNGDVAEN